ncbi:hypothetical protein FB451DRAFT_1554972 [Mycena latifolia]|nr:hypothetical protein FB451DRAFT_1554972 [Mycena latifolia]
MLIPFPIFILLLSLPALIFPEGAIFAHWRRMATMPRFRSPRSLEACIVGLDWYKKRDVPYVALRYPTVEYPDHTGLSAWRGELHDLTISPARSRRREMFDLHRSDCAALVSPNILPLPSPAGYLPLPTRPVQNTPHSVVRTLPRTLSSPSSSQRSLGAASFSAESPHLSSKTCISDLPFADVFPSSEAVTSSAGHKRVDPMANPAPAPTARAQTAVSSLSLGEVFQSWSSSVPYWAGVVAVLCVLGSLVCGLGFRSTLFKVPQVVDTREVQLPALPPSAQLVDGSVVEAVPALLPSAAATRAVRLPLQDPVVPAHPDEPVVVVGTVLPPPASGEDVDQIIVRIPRPGTPALAPTPHLFDADHRDRSRVGAFPNPTPRSAMHQQQTTPSELPRAASPVAASSAAHKRGSLVDQAQEALTGSRPTPASQLQRVVTPPVPIGVAPPRSAAAASRAASCAAPTHPPRSQVQNGTPGERVDRRRSDAQASAATASLPVRARAAVASATPPAPVGVAPPRSATLGLKHAKSVLGIASASPVSCAPTVVPPTDPPGSQPQNRPTTPGEREHRRRSDAQASAATASLPVRAKAATAGATPPAPAIADVPLNAPLGLRRATSVIVLASSRAPSRTPTVVSPRSSRSREKSGATPGAREHRRRPSQDHPEAIIKPPAPQPRSLLSPSPMPLSWLPASAALLRGSSAQNRGSLLPEHRRRLLARLLIPPHALVAPGRKAGLLAPVSAVSPPTPSTPR